MPKVPKKKAAGKRVKKACGLCGKTENLIKTECCKNWICDDEEEYDMSTSPNRKSCWKNHMKYSLCAFHWGEEHEGSKWQECQKCKESFSEDRYVLFTSEMYNFVKLEVAPEIKCVCCDFKSESKKDFAFQLNGNYYCTKVRCRELGKPTPCRSSKRLASLKMVNKAEIKKVKQSEVKGVEKSEVKKINKSKVQKVNKSEVKKVNKSEVKKVNKSEVNKVNKSEVKRVKKACGLCGRTQNLTKTECCKNWICDDEEEYYMSSSIFRNSCSRNHRRYSLCAFHYGEGHDGNWQGCVKCKESFSEENHKLFESEDYDFPHDKMPTPSKSTKRLASVKTVNKTKIKKVKRVKKACGLCGETQNLTKTECCKNWICDDEDEYHMSSSIFRNSCSRNHRRYSLCAFHYGEDHEGNWQGCVKCKESFSEEDRKFYESEEHNFLHKKRDNVSRIKRWMQI